AARRDRRPQRDPGQLRRQPADVLGDLRRSVHPAPDLARGGAVMRRLAILALFAFTACAGELADGGYQPDAGAGADGGVSCSTYITFDPTMPVADALAPVRAAVNVTGAPGVFTYT